MNREDLLQEIYQLQHKKDTEYFYKGMFSSFRSHHLFNLQRPDDNIFFSASILYILKNLEGLTKEEMQCVDEMQQRLAPNFSFYQNRFDRNSYNFWQKRPHKHFPNGKILNHFSKFQLPDDIDTTSIIQMINPPNQEEVLKTHQSLEKHLNGINIRIKNGHPELRKYKAPSTWFGEYMPIEFDICVLSNYLLSLNYYNLPIQDWDIETINLIKQSISNSLFIQNPFKSSPEYPKIEIILYHLSRLAQQTSFIDSEKEQLILIIKKEYNQCKHDSFRKLILQTSLLKCNVKSLDDIAISESELVSYWWFTAGLLSVYSGRIIEKTAPKSLFHFRFSCKAFNLSLIYENLILKQNSL